VGIPPLLCYHGLWFCVEINGNNRLTKEENCTKLAMKLGETNYR